MMMRLRWILMMITAVVAVGCLGQERRSAELPYAEWKRGLPSDPNYFPIAVWLQSPAKAKDYKAAGINLYVALWQGPTAEQLSELKAAGMPVIVDQNRRSQALMNDPTIVGWMHGDEPDNAQEVTDPKTGKKGYGPCIPPQKIVDDYHAKHAVDPSRPIMLNLGQGVANDAWVGRGSGAKLDDYKTYVQGCDIVSFDVYPVADNLKPVGGDNLGYVAKGLDRLREWTGGKKIIWNCIECTRIGGDHKATPEQTRAETWLALIHGSRGLIYFCHQFKPTFDEHALLDDPDMLKTVTATNKQIHELAPVLNSPTMDGRAELKSAPGQPSIDMMVKEHAGSTYLFAVNTHPASSMAEFALKGKGSQRAAEVVGEGRTVTLTKGDIADRFAPYEVHIYRIK